MKAKKIVTISLLAFVAASVAYMFVKETGNSGSGSGTAPLQPSGATAGATSAAPDRAAAGQAAGPAARVVAYYFHGNMRCKTCKTIEAYSQEAIETGFPGELKDGRLEWRVLNVDEPENGHYSEDFSLTTRSVVLERIVNGNRVAWTNLDRIWDLVREDKPVFIKYIRDETRNYLERQ